ncbi:MAG TPA: hypothetical protein VMW42_11260 [Desulfatiglandales bacterium]|nr:hypothetical protein [Desulfatiglandales bacterium]
MSDEKIFDVVIHTTSPRIDPANKPIKSRFGLSSDLYIDRLPRDLSNKIFKACIPGGYNFEPVLQFGQLYSFIRDNPPITNDNDLRWDSDQRLQICLALSRIIHPTSISFEYAARIITNQDGSPRKIIPGPVSGLGSHAFVVETEFNCLTESDAEDLRELLKAFEDKPLRDPIARTMWYLEYAFRSSEIDLRWILIATGIEVMIHTDRHQSTRQFVERIQKLSIDVGAGTIDKAKAEDMYELRSSLSHGQGLGRITPEMKETYKKMEDILRLTIRKAILETSFRNMLSDPDQIRKIWPI